jgi:hypothetical protein
MTVHSSIMIKRLDTTRAHDTQCLYTLWRLYAYQWLILLGHNRSLADDCAEPLRLCCAGVASSERGLAVTTLFVQGLDLTK